MLKLALFLFVALGSSLMALGVLYIAADEFMPYHAAAIQTGWTELSANYQYLILGLLKALGGGALVAGLATSFMAVGAIRKSVKPFRVLLPVVAIGYTTLLCYATYTVQANTPGNPPLLLSAIGVAVAMVASCLLVYSSHTERSDVVSGEPRR